MTSNPIRIAVNGEPFSIPAGCTLQQALDVTGHPAAPDSPVATAVNGRHVPRAARAQTPLSDGDQVTTFEPITGG